MAAVCLGTSALTLASAAFQQAVADCVTSTSGITTALACAATATTNTTNTNQNDASTSDRTQSFGQNISATISGPITGYGLNLVPIGGGRSVVIVNSGGVSATAFTVSPIPTLGVIGDGGPITYSGNGAISNPINSSVTYEGIAFSNVGAGSITLGAASAPISASISGGQFGTIFSAIAIQAANGDQSLFFNGGSITSTSFALSLASSGTGAINVQLTGNTAIQGTYGIDATANGGPVSITSDAIIGSNTSPVNFSGIAAKSANNVSINMVGGSITTQQEGIDAITNSGSGTVTISVAPGTSIKTLGFAQIGDGINSAAGQGFQSISMAGTINATGNGIDSNQGFGGLGITVTGTINATTTGIFAANSGATNIINSGSITGATAIIASTAVIHNSGTIVGTGGTAIFFSGANNVLAIQPGSLITGNVIGTGTDTLQLEGVSSGIFDISTLGLTQQYRGFSTLAKVGSSTWTLTGTSGFTGSTSANAGTLNVTGSIASSGVSVASGATLTGTGKVGATGVASGGTLTPGSSSTPGTLTISGNLALASGSNFVDAVTPTAAGLVNASGTASINGNAIANLAAGTYTNGQQFALITAAGGVSGTFSSFATTGLPGSLHVSLSYDANDVYLNLRPNALAPSLASNVTTNQHNVVAAIDAAVSSGAAVPSGAFNALYGLSGASLNSAIDQISGRIGPNVSSAVGQSFLSFLAMTAEGGAGDAGNFAPGSAYGAASAPHRAQLGPGAMRVWGAAYGGHAGLSGDAASGAAALSASNVGLVGGADMQLADGILAGVTLDWGRQHFNSGNGSGISTDYAFGLYGRADAGPAYVTAAFGYGWHQIATLRVVTVSGTDVLQGKQNADDFGGRIEAGWRMPLDDTYTIAPYGAFAGESFESPAYAETALSGASTFALSYAAHTGTLGRSELGAHLDRNFDLGDGALTADVRAAWAHQLDDLPFTQANFENLATASFQVLGVRPTRDTALLGADLELQYASGLFLGLKGEGQFGTGTTIVEGLGRFGLRW